MNADELIKRVIAYGGDETGIYDRFAGNAALYEICFTEFMEEPNFAALHTAIAQNDHKRAFDAAHALKGLSGNLGVSPFYGAICALVEALRTGNDERLPAAYAEVCHEQKKLAQLLDGSGMPPTVETQPETVGADAASKQNPQAKPRKKSDPVMLASIFVILGALLLIAFLFFRVSVTYRDNVVHESGQHLLEMSSQIRLYIEEQIANDWRVAYSVGDSISDSGFGNDDPAIFGMLQRKQAVWDVSDLMLYTEDGYCVYASGQTETNDVASDTIIRARDLGKYITVIDSRIIYTVPIHTSVRYNGSPIAAISVVQDMKTFLDNMNFSSFDEQAWMYLTEESGVVISALTNENAVYAFNFRSVVRDAQILPLDANGSPDDLLTATVPAAFLVSDGDEKNYVIAVPISTGATPLRLFYLVPEAVVNRTMNGFSWRLTSFSMTMIALFALLAFVTFFFVYQYRKRLFDTALTARERMFDLLVKNTRTAFGLFTVNAAEPDYISSNAPAVVGDTYWTIDRAGSHYFMRNSENTDTPVLRQANEMLHEWDGESVFKSGYIHGDDVAAPYYFEFQLYPIPGEGADFVGIAQDVTQAYFREEATRNAMEMATRANEAKSQFLSNMSHDIRTPMNAIMNMTNFALENIDQPKKLGPYLHTIHESSEHLLHLINDVLDMSRIESGQLVVASAPFDIRKEIERQIDMVRPLCKAKEQTLITDFAGLGALTLCGDALKLSQIVMNLLSNAVKFTPENGAVRFTAAEIPSISDELVNVRLVIEDTGIGISEETMQHIFDPFYRADDKRVNRIEGSGLGLSICKSYVDAMGGSLRCESEEGEGSTFTVELFFRRAALAEAVEPTELGDAPFLGLRCLVAEDNIVNQTIAKTLLERVGFLVDFADDGGECVQKFLDSKPGTYDVVYMDIRMPVLDGYQTTVMLRTSDHPQAKTVPIVAMSANVYAEDIEKARLAGMDAYLGKPIVSFDLIEQTNRALQKKKGAKA